MNKQVDLSVEEIKRIAEQNVGYVELTDEMLGLVSGGKKIIGSTVSFSCVKPPMVCP